MVKETSIKIKFFSASNEEVGTKVMNCPKSKPNCDEFSIPKKAKRMIICFTRGDLACQFCCSEC